MSGRKDINIKALKKALEERRIEVLKDIEIAEESIKPVELDQTTVGRLSRMDAMQVQAMAIEQEGRREQELSRIDAALHRIEEGDYGYCISCDEEIAAKRLENDPASAVCINCATSHENHH